MKHSTKLEREYSLERVDMHILRYLREHPLTTPSTLSRNLEVSRTSIHFRLSKLEKRGWCEKKKVRNLSKWSLTKNCIEIFLQKKAKVSKMSFAKGIKGFEEAYISLAGEAHQNRIYIFEPSEQTKLFIKKVNEAAYAQVSNLIRKNDIIVEVLFGERSVEHIHTMNQVVRKHMYGRPIIAYRLPDTILNFDQVIICFKRDVYFFNYSTLMMTHIHSEEVTANYRMIFEFYRSLAKKIDLNKELS